MLSDWAFRFQGYRISDRTAGRPIGASFARHEQILPVSTVALGACPIMQFVFRTLDLKLCWIAFRRPGNRRQDRSASFCRNICIARSGAHSRTRLLPGLRRSIQRYARTWLECQFRNSPLLRHRSPTAKPAPSSHFLLIIDDGMVAFNKPEVMPEGISGFQLPASRGGPG